MISQTELFSALAARHILPIALGAIVLFLYLVTGTSANQWFPISDSSRESRSLKCCSAESSGHTLVGSYVVMEGFTAKLLLNNKGGDPLEVRPSLFSSTGYEMQLPNVVVPAQSFEFYDVKDWAALGGEPFRSGTLKLVYDGVDLLLGAQINFADENRSLSFEERLVELGRFNSRRQEAIWWMPSDQASVRVVITNTTNEVTSVSARLAKKPRVSGSIESFEFAPHETKILDLRQDFSEGEQFARSDLLGLSLEHNSPANDALLARIWVSERNQGYSNIVRFSNPNNGKSSEYHGAGFQIENLDGVRFKPVIVARNVGDHDAAVSVRVPYTRVDGTKGTVVLPQEIVKPGRLTEFNTNRIVQRVQQEQIAVASLEVAYDTAPGSVIVAAQSISNDRNHVFRVLMNDPLGLPNASGGYPWRIEGTSTTQVYIKNVADYEQDYVASLVWESGGTYTIGFRSIAAHETINIDVKKLRDEQVPDEFGRIIPAGVSRGQIHWSVRRKDDKPANDPLALRSLIGRSQQVDIAKGIVTDYVCVSCCANSYQGAFVKPNPEPSPSTSQDVVVAGQTISYVAVEQQSTCSGAHTQGPPQFVNKTASWSSNDTNVATVNSNGVVTAVAPGSTAILATWTARSYSAIAGVCQQVAQFNVTGSRTIVVPPNVTNVTATGATKVTQITGNSNIIHFVTPKGGGSDVVTLTATISPDTAPHRANIDWEGATEDSSNPLVATVPKSSAAKNVVKIKYSGTVIKELRVWVVWATTTSADIANSGSQVLTGNPAGAGFSYTGGYDFTHTIQPASLITDSDRPNFTGANAQSPPGGNHPIYGSGAPLSGGANKKWDASRQLRFKILNPHSISVNDTSFYPYGFPSDLLNYPSNDVEGNDDSSTGDETNDPYADSGILTGQDTPLSAIAHRAGSDGDTYEVRTQFREFARLEIEGTWYRISDFYLWRFHRRFIRVNGQWQNNSSSKALDNSGF